MSYVDDYDAIRTILRLLPGGEDILCPRLVGREGQLYTASEGLANLRKEPLFLAAIGILNQAIYSGAKVMVVSWPDGTHRPIAEHERGYPYSFWDRALVSPFDQCLRDILISVEDLRRLMAESVVGRALRNKGGRPPRTDWPAIEEHIKARVAKRGHPDEVDQVEGWRTTADVIEDARAAKVAGAKRLNGSWAHKKVSEILRRIKADSGN
jgi:hypothetical protein